LRDKQQPSALLRLRGGALPRGEDLTVPTRASSLAAVGDAEAAIDRLHVVGPVRGVSGHDRHTREFVRQFVKLGVAVQVTHMHGWSPELPADRRETWIDELARSVDAEHVLHFTMPTRAQPVAGRRNVNYTMFEATRIPAEWVRRAYDHELVVVPTAGCRDAWVDSGVDARRVRVAPLGVDAEHFGRPAAPIDLTTTRGTRVSDYSTRVLNVAEPRPRKNVIGLLRVWINATSADDDAVLILKSSLYHEWALTQLGDDILAMQRALGATLANAAPVVLISDALTDDEMLSLYATATHYVSLSHGEGWDMPMMEAAVAGLQLVAPRHSSYVEYLTDDEVEFVPARTAPFRCEGRLGAEDELFFGGLSWWDPDEDAATRTIGRIIGGSAAPKASPAKRIAREYGWDRAARLLLEAME
jgi:glycosyltransferase involved in cell wall biosynthesis